MPRHITIHRVGLCAAVVLAALMLFPVGVWTQSEERSLQFTSIDFPGAVLTVAQGINAGGEVVGWYQDTAGNFHGFLMNGGSFTSIDFPGATATDARGIGPSGEIVGMFNDALGRWNGYRLRNGVFTVANYPGHLNTVAQRITPRGEIVGCYHDTNTTNTMFGMIIGATGLSSISVPASMHNGMTPDGRKLVGLYTILATGKGRGYVVEDGVFLPFDVPGSIFTAAWDISPTGEVVGVFRDMDNKAHGFLWDNAGFTSINYPGATATRAFGINAGGDIVGDYVSGGKRHGFLASRTQWHNR